MGDRVRVSFPLVFLLAVSSLALAACEADAPTDPEPTVADAAELEGDELLSGGVAVLTSSAFAGIDLSPTVDEAGDVVPDRWRNLRVLVDGESVGVRRVGPERMEFDVPVLPSGTYSVDVVAADASSSFSVTLLGFRISESPSFRVGCAFRYGTSVVPVGDQVAMYGRCDRFRQDFGQEAYERRIGVVSWSPTVAAPGIRWVEGLYQPEPRPPEDDRSDVAVGPSVRSGHVVAKRPGPDTAPPDMWVWRLGPDPQPVEPLSCFPAPDRYSEARVVEPTPGLCLAYEPFDDQIWRNGVPVVSDVVPRDFEAAGFVLADDGWATLTGIGELLVFDPSGEVVVRDAETERIVDAAFASDGSTMYVASELSRSATDLVTRLVAVDRATGEALISADVGTPDERLFALAHRDGRIWTAWLDDRLPGKRLYRFDVHDAATFDRERSVAVSSESVCPRCFASWFPNSSILRIDPTGRRAHFTGWDDDFGIITVVADVFR